MTTQPQPMTEEQQATWVRDQFQKANAYLAEKGILTERVLTKESRYLIPQIAIWKFDVQGTTEKTWAISGEVPTDHISANAAGTARDALRYFCYRWQLQADKILQEGDSATATEKEFAALLVRNAESYYPLTEDEKMWAEG